MPDDVFAFHQLYNILDWYWIADDGRIFSSGQNKLVANNDPAYQNFCIGHVPTVWPYDSSGKQTQQSLQDVFDAANIQPPPNITVPKSA